MTILDQLINLMLKKVEVTPVPKQELDDFLSQNNIDICDEHYHFLLKYGNSGFLKQGYAYLDFEEFQDYYLEAEFIENIKLPYGHSYIGMDFNDELLCKKFQESQLYIFSGGKKYEIPYYGGLKELLFFSLLKLLFEKEYFDKIETNIKINHIDEFKSKYLDYEIKDVYIYSRYFFKDNQLIICDDKFYSYNIYYGGILDKIIDDR